MSDKIDLEILEIRIKGFQAWLQHRINLCVENPSSTLTPIDCYEDAMGVFKLTFDREAGEKS